MKAIPKEIVTYWLSQHELTLTQKAAVLLCGVEIESTRAPVLFFNQKMDRFTYQNDGFMYTLTGKTSDVLSVLKNLAGK